MMRLDLFLLVGVVLLLVVGWWLGSPLTRDVRTTAMCEYQGRVWPARVGVSGTLSCVVE